MEEGDYDELIFGWPRLKDLVFYLKQPEEVSLYNRPL